MPNYAAPRHPARHRLKTWPEFFRAVRDGRKLFELRRDDRDYQSGDLLELIEFDPAQDQETGGAPVICTVGYILRGPMDGLATGFCIMQLAGVS